MAPSHESPKDRSSLEVMRLMEQCEGAFKQCIALILIYLDKCRDFDRLKAVHTAEDYDEAVSSLVNGRQPVTSLAPILRQYLADLPLGHPIGWIAVMSALLTIADEANQTDSYPELVRLIRQVKIKYSQRHPPILTRAYPATNAGLRHIVMLESDYQQLMELLFTLQGLPGLNPDDEWWHFDPK